MNEWLPKVRDWAWMGAALCVAVLGFRCMVGAVTVAQAKPQKGPASATAGKAPQAQPTEPTSRAGKRKGEPSKRTQKRSGDEAVGKSVRLMLSVEADEERAEVFVNGRRLGLTPYLGDFACKQGEQLRFEIVSDTGPLRTRSAVCRGTMITVR